MKINDTTISIGQTLKMNQQSQLNDDSKALLDVCKQFEAIFVNMMLKQMRATVTDGGLTEKSQGREIFQSMYDDALSEEISKEQGIGLAQQLYRQLSAYNQRPTYDNQE